jgi:hypothetical protein
VLSNKGTVKIAGGQTGLRYMVHLSLLATERAFSSTSLSEALPALSLTDYREFSADDPEIIRYMDRLRDSDKCPECSTRVTVNAKFCSECGAKIEQTTIIGKLLDEPISQLSVSPRLKVRLQPKYTTVGAIVQASKNELMRIKYIKEVRSRIIKNAAEEFISG